MIPWEVEPINSTHFLFQRKLSGDGTVAFCSIWVLESYIYILPNNWIYISIFTQHCMLIYYLCSFIYFLLENCFEKFRTLRIKQLQCAVFFCGFNKFSWCSFWSASKKPQRGQNAPQFISFFPNFLWWSRWERDREQLARMWKMWHSHPLD